MAGMYDIDKEMGYQGTRTYRDASPAQRRQLNRYKKECDISDEHMFLLLFQRDLELVPYEERNKGDVMANIMLVVGFLLLFNSLQAAMNAEGGANVGLIFLSLASFMLVVAVYFSGILNPYKRAKRGLDKKLKGMPEVTGFDEWNSRNPAPQQKSGRKRRR